MSKPANKPAHPPYSEMVTAAIAAQKERAGSSRQAIVKYIQDNYVGIGPNCSKMVTKTNKKLIENGKVKHGSGGSSRFALTEAGKAKPTKVKKPVAKKPAAKKITKSKKAAEKKPAVKKTGDKKSTKKAGTPKKKGAKTPTKKSKPKTPAKKAGKKPTPKKPTAKKSQKK